MLAESPSQSSVFSRLQRFSTCSTLHGQPSLHGHFLTTLSITFRSTSSTHGHAPQPWTVFPDIITIERDKGKKACSEALLRSTHVPPPITRLPPELLLQILSYDLKEEAPYNYYFRIFALSHVSQHWHDLVHQTPLFWAKIDSTYGTSRAELCIARSLDVPLHLCIDYWDGPQAGDGLGGGYDHPGWLDVLGPVSRRWRELRLQNPPEAENLVLQYLSYPADNLRRLSISTNTEHSLNVDTEIFAGTRPPLQALSVCSFVVKPLCRFNGESLVEFELVRAPCSVYELLEFLLQTPVLVTLRFRPSRPLKVVHEDGESEAGESEEAGLGPGLHLPSDSVSLVYLPLLKHIDLQIVQNSASAIFRSILTPSLEDLRFTSTYTPRSKPLRTILQAASPILQQLDQLELSVSFRMRRIGVSLRQHSNSPPYCRGLSLDIYRDSSFDPSADDPSDSLTSISTILNAFLPKRSTRLSCCSTVPRRSPPIS